MRCNCRLFECSGLLCANVLKVASIKSVNRFLERYVLQRWRKDVHLMHSRIFFDEEYPHMNDGFDKIKDIEKAFNETVDFAIATPTRLARLRQAMKAPERSY